MMTFSDELLDRVAPADAWRSDWPDVLDRAGEHRAAGLLTKRRLIMAFAVLVAVVVPFAALASANDWWFLSVPNHPTPTQTPLVVMEGQWSGHPWDLIAYPSATDGLCFSFSPKNAAGHGGGSGMACNPFTGVPRTSKTKGTPDMSITYLSGQATNALPAYIAGPVTDKASTVQVRFGNGHELRVSTSSGPPPLDHVRFYASPLPAGVHLTPETFSTFLKWIAGVDAKGDVVACLAPRTATNGISHLSDCH